MISEPIECMIVVATGRWSWLAKHRTVSGSPAIFSNATAGSSSTITSLPGGPSAVSAATSWAASARWRRSGSVSAAVRATPTSRRSAFPAPAMARAAGMARAEKSVPSSGTTIVRSITDLPKPARAPKRRLSST